MSNELAVVGAEQPKGVLEVIARAASDPSVDVGKMEALLNMQERLMKMSAEQQFNADLVALQAELPRVSKLGQIINKGTVQSTFARYEDIDAVVRPLMNQYGFAISFDNPKLQGGVMEFTAQLRHRAGHKENYHKSLPIDSSGAKNGTQGAGSTSSYAKRYLLCDILNIVTEGQDNDGNGDPVITKDQLLTIETLMRDTKTDAAKVLNFAQVEDLRDIPSSKYAIIVKKLQEKGR